MTGTSIAVYAFASTAVYTALDILETTAVKRREYPEKFEKERKLSFCESEKSNSEEETDGKDIDSLLTGTGTQYISQRLIEMTSRLKQLLKTPEGDWFKGKLTRHDHFKALARIDDALNRVPEEFAVEDRHRFMASCFWHFMSMHRELKFSSGVIHQLLLRELYHDRSIDEMRFLLGNHMVRFWKVEFSLITRLRLGVVPDTSMYIVVENGIHQRYFPAHDEVSLDDLRVILTH
ncbi:hypothetical protein Ddye_025501 [Dipteronia dyeriana]|uniref:Uncharacterized protein n=1 Tax=Dipteronia dyeriana TaxID=168575 RepID=A0AAD9TKH9_9ROSI|nr:hypothetical protein Ddye_025501 [Dipteronia dyeriana]